MGVTEKGGGVRGSDNRRGGGASVKLERLVRCCHGNASSNDTASVTAANPCCC